MSAISQPVPVKSPERVSLPPAPAAPRSGGPWKLIAFLALIAIGGYLAYRSFAKPQAPATEVAVSIRTAKITTGNLERTTRLTGQTSAREFGNVTAPLLRGPEGNRDLILMKVAPSGKLVKKGALLAEIDGQSMQDHVDDLKDTIEAADADVRKRKAEQGIEWETLQQTLRVAKSEYDKAKLDASAAEVRTDIERQLLNLALEEAAARYKQQQADLASKEISQKAEIKILELTRERHTRHRNRHLVDLSKFTVNAPMNGLAVMSPIFRGGEMGQFQEGDRVSPGQQFMKIVNPNTMQVEASINQSGSSELRIGQPAAIRFDAFPGLELKGKIYSIGALAVGGWRQNFYIRTVPVRLTIEGADSRVIPDLSASADVVLGNAENRTLVPLGAVQYENGKAVAYVKAGENFEKREIQLGLKNDTQAVVESGLKPGEEVRLN
jgi:multidrug efflux pump subunit AcrA (membrane-fusion protein)